MTNGERLEAKIDSLLEQSAWLVKAVKHLLANEAGIDEQVYADEIDEWMAEAPLDDYVPDDMSEFEHVAVRHRPQPKARACPHNQQVLVDGNITCARCGFVLSSSGLQRNTLTPSGQIMADPNPPKWATEQSPGASSKNPGGALVPHSV